MQIDADWRSKGAVRLLAIEDQRFEESKLEESKLEDIQNNKTGGRSRFLKISKD